MNRVYIDVPIVPSVHLRDKGLTNKVYTHCMYTAYTAYNNGLYIVIFFWAYARYFYFYFVTAVLVFSFLAGRATGWLLFISLSLLLDNWKRRRWWEWWCAVNGTMPRDTNGYVIPIHDTPYVRCFLFSGHSSPCNRMRCGESKNNTETEKTHPKNQFQFFSYFVFSFISPS